MSAKRFILVFVLVQAWLGLTVTATPPLTQIYDTLYKADGAPFTGSATISWRSFTAADSSNVPANTMTVQVVGGLLRVRLVPTTNASPNAYYTVRFNADGRVQFTELWAVPPSDLALAVKDVRTAMVATPSPGGVNVGTGDSIQISDVVGLAEALSDRPTRSVAFQANRAAIIDATGAVATASGAPGDCVHVDGTSGACGGGSMSIGFVDLETPAGTVNGVNTVFVLAQTPFPSTSLHLFRNGILQKPSVDFVLTGTGITFFNVAIPQVGDLLVASYRTAGP